VYGREVEDGGLRSDHVQRLFPSMRGPSGDDGDGTQILVEWDLRMTYQNQKMMWSEV